MACSWACFQKTFRLIYITLYIDTSVIIINILNCPKERVAEVLVHSGEMIFENMKSY